MWKSSLETVVCRVICQHSRLWSSQGLYCMCFSPTVCARVRCTCMCICCVYMWCVCGIGTCGVCVRARACIHRGRCTYVATLACGSQSFSIGSHPQSLFCSVTKAMSVDQIQSSQMQLVWRACLLWGPLCAFNGWNYKRTAKLLLPQHL